MRLIHTADLHLDSTLEANLSPIKAKERKKELLSTFSRLVDYANKNNVDAILIVGDLFDKPRVSAKTKDFVLGLIVSNPNIFFLYVPGNHDDDTFLSSLEDKPKNLFVYDSKWKTLSFDDVDITAIKYEGYQTTYDTLTLKSNRVNIVAMHGAIGSKKEDIDIKKLAGKNIDYLALGHYHKYISDEIDSRGFYAYCGCLEARGFDETGQKGFVLVDVYGGKVATEFIPFAKRELVEIQIDISDTESWADIRKLVGLKIQDITPESMVSIRLVGTYDLKLIKQVEIMTDTLNNEFYFARVVDDTKLRINPFDYENDISLKGEFIRGVLASDLSEDDKMKVIEYGFKALMKEEL